MDLLTAYTHHSEVHVITPLSLISTLQFTVTHTLGFSIFTRRILATDFNTVIIPFSLNHTLQISLHYSAHKVFSSQLNFFLAISSQLSSTAVSKDFFNSISAGLDPRYRASGRPQQKTPFPNNLNIVAYVFVAAGTCLPSRCLAMKIYSGSAIPAFRRHVTIYWVKRNPRTSFS
jgi:hypothetical protein